MQDKRMKTERETGVSRGMLNPDYPRVLNRGAGGPVQREIYRVPFARYTNPGPSWFSDHSGIVIPLLAAAGLTAVVTVVVLTLL